MSREKKRVLVVDDHPLFREGIKALIAPLDEFEVVGEAGECGPAVELAAGLDPHVILMDLSLPDGNGIDALREIRARRPDIGVAVVTMHAKVEVLKKAFAAGASGYMVKESAADRLTDCLRAVCEGHSY
ncbi:MAG: response regulator transcription factor, partial [Deltaproteobacteria bacterium]|nr:response regulator transcription factor [Deltaproteobacteria bacterium]